MDAISHLIECKHNIVVHKFNMGDVEDPDLYVASALLDWQQSEQGKFVLNYTRTPMRWHRQLDYLNMGYVYYLTAELAPEDLVAYRLRWPEKV